MNRSADGDAPTAPLEVPELRALARDVVDHHVEQHVVAVRDPAHVRPRAEPRVDLAVGQWREAAVARRRERRQDVDAPEQPVQRAVEEVAEGREVPAQRVRIRQQLRPGRDIADGHGACSLRRRASCAERVSSLARLDPVPRARHPLTDPCSSAAMTWRWNTMKTSRVGSRIRIVPAHSSGMSVA